MKNLVITMRLMYFADVDAITLVNEWLHRYPIAKRRISGRHTDGSCWSGCYYDINLPAGVYLRSESVSGLIDMIQDVGYKVHNPFNIKIQNW